MADETITAGRAKRSTAGNRMRELLEKAHQQDEEEMFKEEEDDEEFAAPVADVRDVYLDEFADTDDEVDDEEAEERELRREEKRKAKGKGKAVYNPLAGQPKLKKASALTSGSSPSTSAQAEALALLDPSIDPSTMAPSTLVLALRKQRREAKRQQRSEVRRSNLRASTLKTDAEIAEREKQEKTVVHRKGRKAMHEGGEARGVRNLSQAELIAEALEEEERNKEELQKWLRREEERRELRRVGRKRVRGPRWTWISRTVGKVAEVIEEGHEVRTRTVEAGRAQTAQEEPAQAQIAKSPSTAPQAAPITQEEEHTSPSHAGVLNGDATRSSGEATPNVAGATPSSPTRADPIQQTNDAAQSRPAPEPSTVTYQLGVGATDTAVASPAVTVSTAEPAALPVQPTNVPEHRPGPDDAGPSSPAKAADPSMLDSATERSAPQEIPKTAAPLSNNELAPTPTPAVPVPVLQTTDTPNQPAEPSQYTRNYLILSQIPGGLPAELSLVLGSHVEWDQVKYIPARNRPINRRRPICPFTGKIAKYRHPSTGIPYADVGGYREIEAMLKNRYLWSEGGFWLGGEEDLAVDEAEEIEGWREALHGGWMAGFPLPVPEEDVVVEEEEEVVVDEVQEEVVVEEAEEIVVPAKPTKKGKKRQSAAAVATEVTAPVSKPKKRRR